MVGSRIRQARLAAGMTLERVSTRLGDAGAPITRAGLSKYETGKSTPGPGFLRSLAAVLGVRPDYFLQELQVSVEWIAFRKHCSLPKKRQEGIKGALLDVLEGYVELSTALHPEEPNFPAPAPVQIPEDAEAAAAALREAWKLGDLPIESVIQTVEDRGGIVLGWSEDERRFDGLSGWVNGSIPLIVVNTAVSADRRRYNVAHELGHMAMACEGLEEKEQESLAHRFAAAFLVPPEIARHELGACRRRLSLGELATLKRKHGLSMQAWVRRAFDLQIIDKRAYQNLFRELSARGWRKAEPVSFDGLEEPTKLRQMVLRALAEGMITEEKARALCPGAVSSEEKIAATRKHPTASTLLRRPRSEREQVLAEAAAEAEEEYRTNPALTDFEAFGSEDFWHDPA